MWNSNNIPYVPPSYSYTCAESALSPAPSLVENFTVNSYIVNGSRIILDLDWLPPSMLNGELGPYNICIGGEQLRPAERLVDSSRGHTCTSQRESVSHRKLVHGDE